MALPTSIDPNIRTVAEHDSDHETLHGLHNSFEGTTPASFEAAGAVTTHAAAADPHAGYLKESVISGLATPAVVLGTAAAAGSTLTPIRSDSTIAAFDATAPSTQAFGDAAVVGTVAFAARRDHKHAMPANPVVLATNAVLLGTAAAAGGATTLMRSNDTIAAFDATNPTTSLVGDAAAVGSAAFAARRDHKHAREAVNTANPPACRVYHNAAQSIVEGAEVAVLFNSERYDTDGMHSTVSLTSRITFTTAGVYLLNFGGWIDVGTDYSQVYSVFKLNGTTVLGYNRVTPSTFNTAPILNHTTVYKFAATNYVEVFVFHDNTANTARNLQSSGNASPEFSATWLGTG